MYESGLLFAFLLWAYCVVTGLLRINSQFQRNLNRIGQRVSWTTGKVVLLDSDAYQKPMWHKIVKFLFLTCLGLAFVLLSWAYVAMMAFSILYQLSKDFGAPQLVKEFRWKMRNRNLSLDEIIREVMKVGGQVPSEFDEAKEAVLCELEERGFSRRSLMESR